MDPALHGLTSQNSTPIYANFILFELQKNMYLPPAINYDTYIESSNTILYAYGLFQQQPNVNRYDHIYIHGSLQSNYWSSEGSRMQLLEICPIEQSMGQVPQEIGLETRIY